MTTRHIDKQARDCWRTRNVSGPCSVCHAHPEVLHIPTSVKGFYCGDHCPDCKSAKAAKGAPA